MLVNICSRRIKQLQNGYLQMHFAGVLRINKKMAFDLEKVCHQNSSSVNKVATKLNKDIADLFCLFDLILYVHSTIFQLCGTGLPGLNQY